MGKTKIYAAYLPQYHETEENNEFWGKGFTDWVAVKKAAPLFDGHNQPRIPKNNNYYDLSDVSVLKWQAELAREHGVDGFNIYHYWFKDGHQVLGKPAELLLSHKEIEIEYFFSWDNTSWIRSWSNIPGNQWAPAFDSGKNTREECLLELNYGDKNKWKQHFEYLLPFFLDRRYVKVDGKPIFAFMRCADVHILQSMKAYWNELAKENGLPGVFLITGRRVLFNKCVLDSEFIYQPGFSVYGKREMVARRLRKYFHIDIKKRKKLVLDDYDTVWKKILKDMKRNINKNYIFGCMVSFDDTPRRGKAARIIIGDTPEKFEHYFGRFYRLACEHNKEFVLLTAWNEWGEGAYLEPDSTRDIQYLSAIKRIKTREVQG